jgi:KDO2-lipid IV(A) lauroyltransferase
MPEMTADQRQIFMKQRLACMCQTLFEMSHIWVKSNAELKKYLVTEYDNSVFESATRSEKGVIILAPHIGNWEILSVYLSQFRPMTIMYRPLKEPSLDIFIRSARERRDSVLVPTNGQGIRKMIKALKSQGMVAFLPDQVPEENFGGVFAPLFGHEAYTMTLAHKLALKTNAKVFIATAYQHEKGFAVHMQAMSDDFYDDDPLIAATCLNQAIEKNILIAPLQNQWEYKRYRVQPDGQQTLYKKRIN